MAEEQQQTTPIQAPGVQKDIHGNPNDRNGQGNRPQDGQGKEKQDQYGNPQ